MTASRSAPRRSRADSTAELYAASEASTSRATRSSSRGDGTGTSISPRFLADNNVTVALTVSRLASCARLWADVRKCYNQWPMPDSGCLGRTTSSVTPATVLDTSIPNSQSTPRTAVLVGRRLGGNERRRSHPLVDATHQTSKLALDGLFSWFESRQVGRSVLN